MERNLEPPSTVTYSPRGSAEITTLLRSLPPAPSKPVLKGACLEPQILERIVHLLIHCSEANLVRWRHRGPFHHLLRIHFERRPDKGGRHLAKFFGANGIMYRSLTSDSFERLGHFLGSDERAHDKICFARSLVHAQIKRLCMATVSTFVAFRQWYTERRVQRLKE